VAPALATVDRFADAGVIPGNGPNGGTVPAMVDAMARALQLNGTKSLHEVMQPAIELADGFVMYNFLAEVFASQQKATSRYRSAYDAYYPGQAAPGRRGIPPARSGAHHAQSGRGKRARNGAEQQPPPGHSGRARCLYKGDIARRIGAAVEADGGLMRAADLAAYQGATERPLTTDVFGYTVCKAGFWSQGLRC
jgi:gamma-glutamyltranspeptidase/glutathione hydrolase